MLCCPAYLIIIAWREASAHRRVQGDGLAVILPLARIGMHPNIAGISLTVVKRSCKPLA